MLRALVLVLLSLGLFWSLALSEPSMRAAWFTLNDVTTGETAAYPELAPQVFERPPDEVYAAVREAAASVPRWKVVRTDDAARVVDVEVRTAFGGFTDDLTARVEPEGTGARVVVRSRSRVGRGDLGENARHIAALQRRLARVLGGGKR